MPVCPIRPVPRQSGSDTAEGGVRYRNQKVKFDQLGGMLVLFDQTECHRRTGAAKHFVQCCKARCEFIGFCQGNNHTRDIMQAVAMLFKDVRTLCQRMTELAQHCGGKLPRGQILPAQMADVDILVWSRGFFHQEENHKIVIFCP